MNIDINNYESWFILYMDDELDPSQKREVEDFIRQHPALEEELQLIRELKLQPEDENISAFPKEILYRSSAGNITIDSSNYEEYFCSYVDDELNEQEKEAVERFANAHPAYAKELNLFLEAKLDPEEVVIFSDKSSLYREEKKTARVLWMRWASVAAAAVIVLMVGTWMYQQPPVDTYNGEISAPLPLKNDSLPAEEIETVSEPERNAEKNISSPTRIDEEPNTEKKIASVVTKQNTVRNTLQRKEETTGTIEAEMIDRNDQVNNESVSNNDPQGDNEKTEIVVAPVVSSDRPKAPKKEVEGYRLTANDFANQTNLMEEEQPDNVAILTGGFEGNKTVKSITRKTERFLNRVTSSKRGEKDKTVNVAAFAVGLK
jgi:hypothetical protein